MQKFEVAAPRRADMYSPEKSPLGWIKMSTHNIHLFSPNMVGVVVHVILVCRSVSKIFVIKYKKFISLQHRVREIKSHITALVVIPVNNIS